MRRKVPGNNEFSYRLSFPRRISSLLYEEAGMIARSKYRRNFVPVIKGGIECQKQQEVLTWHFRSARLNSPSRSGSIRNSAVPLHLASCVLGFVFLPLASSQGNRGFLAAL